MLAEVPGPVLTNMDVHQNHHKMYLTVGSLESTVHCNIPLYVQFSQYFKNNICSAGTGTETLATARQ